MVPGEGDRKALAAFSQATHIIVCDAETQSLTDGSSIIALLRKFDAEGFSGVLGYISGGFAAIADSAIVDWAPLAQRANDSTESGQLCAADLPMSAFQKCESFIDVSLFFFPGGR